MKENKVSLIVSFIIFLAVVAALVYVAINNKAQEPIQVQTQAQNQEQTQPVGAVGTEQKDMQNNTQKEGVKAIITKEGKGEVAKSGDTILMNYTGKLTNGKVFDSNVDPKFGHVEPFEFTLDAGQVIKGWDMGVAGMKVGEKRTLEIPAEFAYGVPGIVDPVTKIVVIPPNATLIFDVELVSIKK